MSKKAKQKRKEHYKSFLEGMVKHREYFIDKKINLIEKMLSDDSLKNTLMNKNRQEMNILERAVVDTIKDRNISSLEDFQEMSESFKENQNKSAKFKYTAKKI